jgi:hypothetical protein
MVLAGRQRWPAGLEPPGQAVPQPGWLPGGPCGQPRALPHHPQQRRTRSAECRNRPHRDRVRAVRRTSWPVCLVTRRQHDRVPRTVQRRHAHLPRGPHHGSLAPADAYASACDARDRHRMDRRQPRHRHRSGARWPRGRAHASARRDQPDGACERAEQAAHAHLRQPAVVALREGAAALLLHRSARRDRCAHACRSHDWSTGR